MTDTQERIGITSTIPVEVLYAAQCRPVDLNNVFITDGTPGQLIETAERAGMPRSSCVWVKGIYSAILKQGLTKVIGVVQGDCAHVVTMLETLLPAGVEFIPFAYPYEKVREQLRLEIQKLMVRFSVGWDVVEEVRERLNRIRAVAHRLDYRTWHDGDVSGRDNFEALINCSDFKSDPDGFEKELHQLECRPPGTVKPGLRLGLLGVPGVYTDLYQYLEACDARVMYHELARQFAMPNYQNDLLDQYLTYTYPYSVRTRLQDIEAQIELRQLDGCVHYVQSFCHHQLEDRAFKKHLSVPVITLEGDRVGALDGRSRTRLDAFLEMLRHKQGAR